MTLTLGDAAVGYAFKFSVDGIECPSVIDVTGLKLEVDKIEVKSNTKDGKYIISHMPGRMKPGEITVTRQLDKSKAMVNWYEQAMKGLTTTARKSAKVEILATDDTVVRTYEFKNVWCVSIETNEYKAGGTDAMTEKMTMTWTEATVS
jgi:phage tail-like protein